MRMEGKREYPKMANASIDRMTDVLIDVLRENMDYEKRFKEARAICERIFGDPTSRDIQQVMDAIAEPRP